MGPPDRLLRWIRTELNIRNLSQTEASKRAGLNPNAISDIVNGQTPGLKVCVALARLFNTMPEEVLRLAGHLPPKPPPVTAEDEMMRLFRRLSSRQRSDVLEFMRIMAFRPGPRSAFTVDLESDEPDALAKLAEIWDRTPPSLRHFIPLILRDEVARYEAELAGGLQETEEPIGDESTDGGDRVKCNCNGGEEEPGEEH